MMRFLMMCLSVVMMLATHAQAQDRPDYDVFGAWPVLYEGRLKTMDSTARSVFYDIAQTDSVDGVSAIEWLTNTVFDPSWSVSRPFIKAPVKKGALDLPERSGNRYSLNEIMKALGPYEDIIMALEQRNPATYSSGQKDLMSLYRAVTLYNQVIQSFSMVLPLANAQGDDLTYRQGGGSDTQRFLIAQGGQDNRLLRFIPNPDHPHQTHMTLWEQYAADDNHPMINTLEDMAIAWNIGDIEAWNNHATAIKSELYNDDSVHPLALQLEYLYASMDLVFWAMILYMAVLGMFFVKPLNPMMVYVCGSAFVVHVVAIMLRTYILSRPPTGTLYETLLFGALIVGGLGLFLGWKAKGTYQSVMVGSSIVAAFLLFVSRGFVEGDSLNVLVAVLNTNFWLSTHVTCVIIGYALCLMVAMGGHMVLWNDSEKIKTLLMPLSVAALLFTSVGTLLGGIWADQSWGRFWGWDPKENGALLIVIWLTWVIHGRISKHFQGGLYFAMLSLTTIMVAVTWFGVNLLGVGLHSYGFISGIAFGLGAFCGAQIIVVMLLYYRYKKLCSIPS